MTDDNPVSGLPEAAAIEAQRIISKLPSELPLDRKMIHDMLELAFMSGSIWGAARASERIQLALANTNTTQ